MARKRHRTHWELAVNPQEAGGQTKPTNSDELQALVMQERITSIISTEAGVCHSQRTQVLQSTTHISRMWDTSWNGINWDTQPSGCDSVQEYLCRRLPLEDIISCGCEQQCQGPVGLEIPDKQGTASSKLPGSSLPYTNLKIKCSAIGLSYKQWTENRCCTSTLTWHSAPYNTKTYFIIQHVYNFSQ